MDIRTYLTLEHTLHARLIAAWRALARPYFNAVTAAVQDKDFHSALDVARTLDLSSIGDKNREFLKYLLLACANFGAKMAGGTGVATQGQTALLEKQVDKLIEGINYQVTVQAVGKALQLIASAQQADTVQKKDPSQYVQDFVSFANGGDKALQLISSQHSSRLSTWGFVAEAEIEGVTRYKVTAVLDGRTSDFCRMLNGHIFEVAEARRSINEVLALDSYDDVKHVQPWPNQSAASIAEYKAMATQDLVDRNLHIPPYHPHCRTLLTLAKSAPRTARPEPSVQSSLQSGVATLATFNEMGNPLSQAQVDHWNTYVGVNPLDVAATMTGIAPHDLIVGSRQMGSVRVEVEADGDVTFTGNHEVLQEDDTKPQDEQEPGKPASAQFKMVYDPYGGNFYLDYLKTHGMTEPRMLDYAQAFYTGMFEVAEGIGAETVIVAADSAADLNFYTQAGFKVSPANWFTFKGRILNNAVLLEQLASALPADQFQTVLDILNNKDEEGMFALAALPYTVEGTPVLTSLLAGDRFLLTLDSNRFPTAHLMM